MVPYTESTFIITAHNIQWFPDDGIVCLMLNVPVNSQGRVGTLLQFYGKYIFILRVFVMRITELNLPGPGRGTPTLHRIPQTHSQDYISRKPHPVS